MANGSENIVLRDDVVDLLDPDDLGFLEGLDRDVVSC